MDEFNGCWHCFDAVGGELVAFFRCSILIGFVVVVLVFVD